MNNTFTYYSFLIFRNQCLLWLSTLGLFLAHSAALWMPWIEKAFQQNRSFLPSSHVDICLQRPCIYPLCEDCAMYFDLRVLIRWFLLEIIILGRSGSEQCTTELTLARKLAFLPTILEQIRTIYSAWKYICKHMCYRHINANLILVFI